MYQTTSSIAARRAQKTDLKSGSTRIWNAVLCCPVVVGIGTAAVSATFGASAEQANYNANHQTDPGQNTQCPDDSLNFTAATTSISMGRLTNSHPDVAPGASIDQLVAALRA